MKNVILAIKLLKEFNESLKDARYECIIDILESLVRDVVIGTEFKKHVTEDEISDN